MAGTRAQSCDRYGSGTLHPGQVLGGSLPLLSLAFRRSHFRRQRRERSWQRKVELWARKFPVILPKFRLPRKFRDLLHASNLRYGTYGFTSPPKEGVLRIFSPLKIRRLRPGLNPRTWVLKASTLPLDHRSLIYTYTYIYNIVQLTTYFGFGRTFSFIHRVLAVIILRYKTQLGKYSFIILC